MKENFEKIKEKHKKVKEKFGCCGIRVLLALLFANILLAIFYHFSYIGSIFIAVIIIGVIYSDSDEVFDEIHHPIDEIDMLFYKQLNDIIPKYIMGEFCTVVFISSFLNLFVPRILSYVNDNSINIYAAIFYGEFFIISISFGIAAIIFNGITPYDFSSKFLYTSKNDYLIRIWNFLFFRRKIIEGKEVKKISRREVAKRNRTLSKSNQVETIRKELRTLNIVFLKELDSYIKYPQNFGGNPLLSTEFLNNSFDKLVSIINPFVIGFIFGDSSNPENSAAVLLCGIVSYLLILGFYAMRNRMNNKNLMLQMEAVLPVLLHEELERRNGKKPKRPHRYSNW